MGPMLSTGIVARPGLRITQDRTTRQMRRNSVFGKRLPSYIPSSQVEHSRTMNNEGESSTRLLSLFLHHLFIDDKISMLISMYPLVFTLWVDIR